MKKENSAIFGILIGIGLVALLAFFLSGQNRSNGTTVGEQETNQDAAGGISPAEGETPQGMNPDYGELTEEQIRIADAAIGDLLNSSEGITPPMITVKSFEAQEFNDASLGCPKEGELSAQVITPGYQVILEAQGTEYDYRIAEEGGIVRQCE